jgi:quercetin dioxygenase-like cupin family protein
MAAVILSHPTAFRPEPDGAAVAWKLAAAATGGALALSERELPPGFESRVHVHPHADEGFYVLAGEVLLVGERRLQRVPAGGFVWIPRGERHGFMNASEEEGARLLAFHAPAAGARANGPAPALADAAD